LASSTVNDEGSHEMERGSLLVHQAQRPRFVSDATGEVDHDPLALAGDNPRFALDKLAVMLDNPFLEAEFPPPCPWQGVSRLEQPTTGGSADSSSEDDLRAAFSDAVRACIGDSDVVAVMYSGGLDSTAVLATAAKICADDGRRLLAMVWNLDDQFGVPTGQLAHRQLRAMGLTCELRILPVEWHSLPEPDWSPTGVRIDYYTRLHRGMIEAVMAEGGDVLLTGVGGDEVLAGWQFMSPDLIKARRWRDLAAYEWGFFKADTAVELVAETISGLAPRLSAERSFDLYSAFAYGPQFRPLPQSLITERFRPVVEEAARDWRRRRYDVFVDRRQTWSQASLWDSVYPLAYAAHPTGSPVYEASPFLEPAFIDFALGLPLVSRFRRLESPPYHWYKPLHRQLLPDTYWGVAPKYKQSYSHIFREYQLDMLADEPLVSVELGLVKPVDMRDLDRIHARLPSALRNVEQWIRGALAQGAQPC